jgi:ATP-dependent Clp protease adaptor protein ClpS
MINFSNDNDTRKQQQVAVEEKTEADSKIMIYNDDVNTFDHVINCLVEVCDHDLIQAEQCTIIIHYNGKCDVKYGDFDKLRPLCDALTERGLSASIE